MEEFTYALFVYGTLKKNQRANYQLGNSKLLGTAVTKPLYQLYSCGSFPAMVSGQSRVIGEIYAVSESVKKHLDIYEGVSEGFYNFEEIYIEKLTLNSFEGNEVLQRPIHSYIYKENIEGLIKINEWPCIYQNFTYNLR